MNAPIATISDELSVCRIMYGQEEKSGFHISTNLPRTDSVPHHDNLSTYAETKFFMLAQAIRIAGLADGYNAWAEGEGYRKIYEMTDLEKDYLQERLINYFESMIDRQWWFYETIVNVKYEIR